MGYQIKLGRKHLKYNVWNIKRDVLKRTIIISSSKLSYQTISHGSHMSLKTKNKKQKTKKLPSWEHREPKL